MQNFLWALEQLKNGKRIRRQNWEATTYCYVDAKQSLVVAMGRSEIQKILPIELDWADLSATDWRTATDWRHSLRDPYAANPERRRVPQSIRAAVAPNPYLLSGSIH